MRFVDNYSDFLSALREKTSNDAKTRNDAKNALGILKQTNPKLYNEYRARYEGIVLPTPTITQSPRVESAAPKHIRKTNKLSEREIQDKAYNRLVNNGYIMYNKPPWITTNDVLNSFPKLDISDLITEKGNLVKGNTILRKCIRLAAEEGRIDELKLRQIVFDKCRRLWNYFPNEPDYSFDQLKWFILKVIPAEELTDTFTEYGVSDSKVINLLFDNRIKELDINELKEEELKKKVEKMRREQPSEIRLLVNKALNYIQKHNKTDNRYPLPENCNVGDLKIAIDKISDDDLYSTFDGKRVDADILYKLCIKVLTNTYNNKPNEINMNAQGRKKIAKQIASLENIKSILENMIDDEEAKYDNMPEGLQESERGEQMQEAIEALESACDSLNEAIISLNEI